MTGWTSTDFVIDAAVYITLTTIGTVVLGLLIAEIYFTLRGKRRRERDDSPRFYRPEERKWR